jgi:glycine cleavage system regulatory protein
MNNLLQRLDAHLRQLAPHVAVRDTGQLLAESRTTIASLTARAEDAEARNARLVSAACRLRDDAAHLSTVGTTFYDMDMGDNGSEAIDSVRESIKAYDAALAENTLKA